MRTLILMRHAKSDWSGPEQSDFDRPLNPRGKRNARTMGNWLREQKLRPDEALVSSAQRTQDTWERLQISGCQTWFLADLYLAAPAQMNKALMRANAATVLMIGHNPGIAEFAVSLIGEVDEIPMDLHAYPTCATSVIDFPVKRWDQVMPGSGKLRAFATPRALEAAV